MEPSAVRVRPSSVKSGIKSHLVFWYRDQELNFEAEYEARGAERFSVKFFRSQASEFIFNHDEYPEVVILDEHLSMGTATSLVTKLKKAKIPVVLHSGKFDATAKSKAVSWGVDDYLFGAIGDEFWTQVRLVKRVKDYTNRLNEQPAAAEKSGQELPAFKNFWMKRAFDITASLLLLLLLSPILLLIAIIIKLESPGPIIYKSKRAGAGYRVFDFYKFRSMKVDADKDLTKLNSNNQYASDAKEAVFFKIKNDPRVTRFGRILRKTSLDEVPQLVNVLLGDMSLVGNRPLPLYEAERLTKDRVAWRFLAPAGLTGLWQVKKRGKGNMSIEERMELDETYARNYSVWTDLRILYSTFSAIIQEERV